MLNRGCWGFPGGSFQSQINAMPKHVQTTAQFELISHANKVMLKILQARLQQYMHCELPDVPAGFRKVRVTRDQIAKIHRIIKKARQLQNKIYFCFINYAKTLTLWIITNCGQF